MLSTCFLFLLYLRNAIQRDLIVGTKGLLLIISRFISFSVFLLANKKLFFSRTLLRVPILRWFLKFPFEVRMRWWEGLLEAFTEVTIFDNPVALILCLAADKIWIYSSSLVTFTNEWKRERQCSRGSNCSERWNNRKKWSGNRVMMHRISFRDGPSHGWFLSSSQATGKNLPSLIWTSVVVAMNRIVWLLSWKGE